MSPVCNIIYARRCGICEGSRSRRSRRRRRDYVLPMWTGLYVREHREWRALKPSRGMGAPGKGDDEKEPGLINLVEEKF